MPGRPSTTGEHRKTLANALLAYVLAMDPAAVLAQTEREAILT